MAAACGALAYRVFGGAPPEPLAPTDPAAALAVGGSATISSDGRRLTSFSVDISAPVAWEYQFDGSVVGTPVAASGRVFATLATGDLIAIDGSTGTELWRVTLGSVSDAPPAATHDLVLVTTRDGLLRAFSSVAGTLLWSYRFVRPLTSSPGLVGGLAFAATEGELSLFDARTGALLATVPTGDGLSIVPPASDGRRLVLPLFPGLVIVDASTGVKRFRLDSVFFNVGDAVSVGPQYVVALTRGRLLVLDRDIQRPWWEPARGLWSWANLVGVAPEPPWHAARWGRAVPSGALPPAVDADRIYLAEASGGLSAFDLETGGLDWQTAEMALVAPPTVTPDGILLVGADSVRLLDVSTGAELVRRAVPGGHITGYAISESALYLMSGNRLFAIRPAVAQ